MSELPLSIAGVPSTPRASTSPGPAHPVGPSFRAALDRAAPDPVLAQVEAAAESIAAGERQMSRAIQRVGHVSDPTELLALQMGVYRYVQELELATRVVEKTTSAIKTVMQSQQ